MYLHFNTREEEGVFDYAGFNSSIRHSGIYVDPNSMTGGGIDEVTHSIYGDEEAIKYYYSLWYYGYRGEKCDDPKLDAYIKCGREQAEIVRLS